MSNCKTTEDAETVRAKVREGYGQIATKGGSCCGSSSCGSGEQLAEKIGYSAEELAALPEGANMGLSCGNPTAIASLKPGEVVLDLGSGGGFDVFIAGRKVGPTGRAIGVDMTPEMLAKARRNIAVVPQTDRSGQRRVPARRDRTSARGRRQRGCRHLQLRHQSLARQTAGLARDRARAQARRARGGVRPGAAQAAAGRQSAKWSRRWSAASPARCSSRKPSAWRARRVWWTSSSSRSPIT